MTLKPFLSSASVGIVVIALTGCADPPHRTEVTSTGQGSVNLKRVPVEPKTKPADRVGELEKQIAVLRGQVSELQAENARLRMATQPSGEK